MALIVQKHTSEAEEAYSQLCICARDQVRSKDFKRNNPDARISTTKWSKVYDNVRVPKVSCYVRCFVSKMSQDAPVKFVGSTRGPILIILGKRQTIPEEVIYACALLISPPKIKASVSNQVTPPTLSLIGWIALMPQSITGVFLFHGSFPGTPRIWHPWEESPTPRTTWCLLLTPPTKTGVPTNRTFLLKVKPTRNSLMDLASELTTQAILKFCMR